MEHVASAEQWKVVLEANLGIPFTDGNSIEPLRNGNQIFPAMLEAIDEATSTVDFLTFVYWKGDIADEVAGRLVAARRRGVETRVLLDGFGARAMRQDLVEEMRAAGVQIAWFRPLRPWHIHRLTHRTHRKVLVCDDRVGFTGGVGIAEEWEGAARDPSEWRETHFRVRGPCVLGLRAAFLGNWMEAVGEVSAFSDRARQLTRRVGRRYRCYGERLRQAGTTCARRCGPSPARRSVTCESPLLTSYQTIIPVISCATPASAASMSSC